MPDPAQFSIEDPFAPVDVPSVAAREGLKAWIAQLTKLDVVWETESLGYEPAGGFVELSIPEIVRVGQDENRKSAIDAEDASKGYAMTIIGHREFALRVRVLQEARGPGEQADRHLSRLELAAGMRGTKELFRGLNVGFITTSPVYSVAQEQGGESAQRVLDRSAMDFRFTTVTQMTVVEETGGFVKSVDLVLELQDENEVRVIEEHIEGES